MLPDLEPSTTSNQTEHGAATTREIRTPVKLFTLSTADLISFHIIQFFHEKTKTKNKTTTKNTRITDMGQSSTLLKSPE